MRLHEIATPALPTKSFTKLYHVGTLDLTHKQRGSLEGAGLSVSQHPEEWMQIAKLGGDVWQVTRPGNRFLNFSRMNKSHKTVIANWAVEHGLATRQSLWRVSYYDDEADETRYFEFSDSKEAEDEASEMEDATIQEIPGSVVGTPTLYQRMLSDRHEPMMTADFITIAYVEDVMHIDGVWWQERLDVENLSAPRGVIIPAMIRQWQFKRLSSAQDWDQDH